MAANARALAKAILRAQSAPSPAATAAAAQMGTFGGPALPAGGSPLVASSYGDWTSGRVQPALPRDYSTFLAGMFGPLAPMIPMPIDQAPDGSPRAEPRVRQYPVSWNMPHGVPGDEGLKLASFGQLRTIAETYSVAQACIRTRSQEILGIDWDIVPTKEAEKKMRGDEKARREFDERRAPVKKFFNKPDPNYFNFGSWLTAVLDDVFVVDALSMYLHPSRRPGKGIAGSDLAALDVIDGTTIRPYMDLRGAKPSAPNPAYAQYLYGVPRVDLMTMLSGQDVKDLGEGKARDYRGDHLLYLPYVTRSWTPYGFPPVERALVPIMSALQRQQYQAAYFSDGSVPSVFVSVGNVDASPAQCRQLQDALNAMAGDPAWKHRIIVIPGGAKIEPMRPNPLADAFDDLVMTQVCMAFDIQPMELGITPRTSTTTSGGAQNQMAKASENINQRKALKPLLKWLKDIFDAILHNVLGYTDMAWHWEGMEEGEDEAQTVETLIAEVKGGLISVDEARVIRGHQPWGMDITGEPVYMTATDVIPLAAIDRKTGKPVGAAPPPGAGGALGGPPPGGPSGGGAPKKPGGGPSGGGGQPVLTPAHAAAQAHADALAKIPEPEVPAHEDYDEVGERVERDRRKAAAAVQVAKARLAIGAGPVVAKVGPKGYEHGWKKVHPISAATIAGYTDAQRDAMRFYSSWEYNNINRQLRQGTTYGRVTEVVDTIRSAMTPTSHDTVTYRRASGRDFGLDEYPTLEQLQAQAGKTFTQPAFMSTTLDEGRLAGHPAVVHMQVDVPAGTMAASLHDAGLDHDHELLLDVGQRYELVSVEPMGAHEFRAHVRVLPADNAGTILTDDEQDTADELTRAGATVHPDGTVTAYHYTTPENAAEIRRTGRMRGAEDGLFFTTKPGEGESQGGSGRGGAVVEFRLPLGAVQIDDLFDDEAHLRIPLRRQGDSADVSGYIHKAEIRLDGRAIHNSLLRFTQPEPAAPPVDVPGALRELDLIRRRLNKGRTIDDWTVQHLPDDVFDRLQVDYPQGVDRAVDNARTAVKNIGRRQTRDQVTGPLEHAIAGGLGALVDQVAAGELSTLGFVDDAVEVLRVCIREALALGVQHARGGATLGKAVTGAPTGNPIDPRLRLYAGTAPAAYEVGYGLATIGDADDPDNIAVRWHPLPDACALCAPREGQLFTVGTLPGWPGEGGFGPDAAVCEGGPNCRCSLSYEMIPTLARLAGVGQDAPPATSNPLVARWRDAVRTGPDAVERTIDEVAGERAEAQRPFLMRLLKDLLSTLARAFGRRGTTKSADGGGDGLAGEVFEYLNRHYPAKVLGWVHDADWTDPTKVPLVDIDMARRPGGRDPAKVKAIAELVRHGERLDPVVLVRTPGQDRLQIADGYHRTLGREHAGKKRVLAYVGEVDVDEGPWDRAMHDAKLNKAATVTKTGDGHGHHIPGTPMVYSHGWKKVVPDAAGGTALADREPGRVSHSAARPNPDVVKAAKRVCEAAGLAVVAADTGRVLMLQRAHDPDDDAGGMWEFPGGRLEPGEDPLTAARREWAEETGCTVPKGQHRGGWTSGVYQGFVWQVPDETCVPIHGDRDAVTNPDDPDRDQLEAIAWWDPDHLTADNPAVRAELAAAIGQVKRALAARAVKCLTCGCDQPHNEHGDPRNITWEELVDAAEAAGTSPEEAWANAEHAIGHEQRIDKRRGHDGWRHQLRDREGPDAGQWIDMPDVGGVDLNPFGAAGTPVSPVDVDAPLFPWPHPTSTAPLPTPPKVGKHGPTRDQIRAALASGEHHREALTGGQIAATQRVTFNNGTVLVHKTYIGRERPRAEYLTSLVGDAVGAPVPAVVLDPDNESALWMGFIDNADPAAAYHITTPMQEVYQTPEALRLGLLDVLTFNVDRHRGNWLIRDDDQTPAGIDHGEAFIHGSWRAVDTDGTEVPLFDLSDGAEIENAGPFVQMFVGLGQQPALRVPDRTDLRGYRFRLLTDEQHAARPPGDLNVWHLSRWIPNPLTADEAAQVRVGLEGLQAEFRAQRRGYWWDDMMARLDQIERHAVGVDQQDRVGSLA